VRYVPRNGKNHELIQRKRKEEIPGNQYRGLSGNGEKEKHIDCLLTLCELGMERKY